MVNSNNSEISCVFKGRFIKVAESKETIVDKKTGEITTYYVVVLSNGAKVFKCTCGENADIVKKVNQFIPCMMYIDVVEKNGVQKLKITHVDLPEQKSGGVK